jgi:AcrR family transcriptional regulator
MSGTEADVFSAGNGPSAAAGERAPSATGTTRDRIVDAAEHLMRSVGLARTTTKEIAREAGCSEAAIYKHFSSKEELFTTVLGERLPPLGAVLDVLDDERAGSIEDRLTHLAAVACTFYESTTAIAASLFAEPALLARHRAGLAELGAGPHVPVQRLATFLRHARERGDVSAEADPDASAALLLGACLQRAFLMSFSPPAPPPIPAEAFAADLVRTLLHGLQP